jgi:hypothetical protein
MPELELFQIFTLPLNRMGILYFVTGAAASIVYGEVRITHDIDLVVELRDKDVGRLVEAFPPEDFYCPPEEVIRVEAKRPLRGHFNLIHHQTGLKADVYLVGRDELHRWAMERRREISVAGEPFFLAPPEYVILRKLEYYREGRSEKHLTDVAGMLAVSGGKIDWEELERRIDLQGLSHEWDEARKRTEA